MIQRVILPLTLLLGGCIFIGPSEYDDRYAALSDQDMDTYLSEQAGGQDCDDTNATIHPGALDTWYDGVDSDCAGNDDYDKDGDGAATDLFGGTDCDDEDPEMGPHADEIWYDGVDQDCAGDDDYDADGDGFQSDAFGGEDCLDNNASAYPGAEDTWYDGVDADCAGDDDYDADGDGWASWRYGGQDCDDDDPDTNTQPETLGDEIDGDCDTRADTFHFNEVDTHDASGLIGPRLDINSFELAIAWAAEEIIDGPATSYEPVAVSALDPMDPRDGVLYDYWIGYDYEMGVMDPQMDFSAADGYWTWVSSFTDDAHRKLEINVVPPMGLVGSIAMTGSDAGDWGDMQLYMDESGDYAMVACSDDNGEVWLSAGDRDGILDGEPSQYTTVQASGYDFDVCEYHQDQSHFLLASSRQGTLTEATLSGDTLALGEPDAGWTVLDMESSHHNGHGALAISDPDRGLYLVLDGIAAVHATTDTLVELDVSTSSKGVVYLCGVADSGRTWLLYGDHDSGLTEVTLFPDVGEATVEDCGVMVTPGNVVVLAVRGGDQLRVGYVNGI